MRFKERFALKNFPLEPINEKNKQRGDGASLLPRGENNDGYKEKKFKEEIFVEEEISKKIIQEEIF